MYENINELSKKLKSKFFFDYDIGKHTWFRTGGKSEIYCIVDNQKDLKIILSSLGKMPYIILGAGSNILVRDGGFKGIVFKLGKSFNQLSINNNKIIAGASILDSNLSKFAFMNSIKNLEFYSSIPGSVGGAIKMNAGCYGYETKDIIYKVTLIDEEGEIKDLTKQQLNLGYRKSNIKKEIILSAEFDIKYEDKDIILKKITEIKNLRTKNQPSKSKTGGSTFKNPKDFYAAELIEKSGCKDLRIGDAHVSEIHSNFLINDNNASAKQIEDLGKLIIEKVYNKFQISLEWEIIIIGDNN